MTVPVISTPPSKICSAKVRNSNLELFRIITMIAIVAHHYVVNSGLTAADGPIYSDLYSWQSAFLLLFGAFGKTGINCFVLITGYFMCKSRITATKFLKLLAEVYFYKIIVYLVFLLTGYQGFSISAFVKVLIPFTSITDNFTGCYLVFFLLIPFLTVLVKNMNEKKHLTLLVILLGIYTVFGSVPVFSIRFNYVTWYCVLFIIASYIRLYPKKLWNNTKLWGWLTLILILTAYASVLACTYLPPKLGIEPSGYFFLSDSNKILAVLLGISSFLFFKNVKIRQSAFINTVASTTFGVLLIHANSDTMRQWLWVDTLKNTQMFSSNLIIIHAIGAVAGVFIICSFIDFLRIKLIENPLFNWLKRHNADSLFDSKINNILNKLCNKYNAR